MERESVNYSIEEDDTRYSDNFNDSKSTTHKKNENSRLDNTLEEIINPIFLYILKDIKIELQDLKVRVSNLCMEDNKYYIILLLLRKIRNIITRYKASLISEIEYKFLTKEFLPISYKYYSPKCNSRKDTTIKEMRLKSPKNCSRFKNQKCELKKYLSKLLNFKKFLFKLAPLLENVFEEALSSYEKFSILDCVKEDYYRYLIMNSYFFDEKFHIQDVQINISLAQIKDGLSSKEKTMTKKLTFFEDMHKFHQSYDKYLKIGEIGSSIDEKYPEDAQIVCEIIPGEEKIFENEEDKINHNYFLESGFDDDFSKNAPSLTKNSTFSDEINNSNIVIIEDKNIKKTRFLEIEKDIEEIKEIGKKERGIKNVNELNPINNFHFSGKNNISYEFNSKITPKPKRPNLIYPLNDERLKRQNMIMKSNNMKDNKNNKNKNQKQDKKEIPSDIDDLVKYITNDDKPEVQAKKKKKNRKKNKKKNKNDGSGIAKDINYKAEEHIEIKDDEEINIIKKNLVENSINRFLIHKIKFKFSPKWLEKITKLI